MSENQATPTELQLRYRIAGRMPSIFAHNMLIQGMPESVLLSFFETILPPKPEMTAEDLAQLQETGLLAECVARITMPPQAFLEAADAMQRVATAIRKGIEKGEIISNADIHSD